MRFKQIPSSSPGNEAYLCEFEGAANIENDLVTALGSQLDVMLDQGIKWVIVDFSNVSFISSAGVGTLLSRRRKFIRSSGDLILCSVPDEIIYVLRELNLLDPMNIAPESTQAARSIGIDSTQASV